MGKKIFGVIAFAAIAAVAGWNYQQNKQEVEFSDLALENIEALAQGEMSSGYAEKHCNNEWSGGLDGGMNHSCTCTGSGNIIFCI